MYLFPKKKSWLRRTKMPEQENKNRKIELEAMFFFFFFTKVESKICNRPAISRKN